MKKELLDKISLEQLNAYLDGSLSREETEQIDSLLDQSQEFQLLVDEYVAMQMEINNEQQKTIIIKPKRYWYYVAAVVCLVIVSGVTLICYNISNNTSVSQSQISTYSIQSHENTITQTADSIINNDK